MQWIELTAQWQTLIHRLSPRMRRLPLPRPQAIIALAIGCALLTLHTLTASAGPIINTTGIELLCESMPCIGPITVQKGYTDADGFFVDLTFNTSINATIVAAASTQAPVSDAYYNEFAHVDSAAMQLIPAQKHGIELRNLKQNTTYHYVLIAVVDAQNRTRVEGTFRTGQLIDGNGPGWNGNPVSE